MSLDDVVTVAISLETSALALPGFGTPMILVGTPPFGERLRYYSDTDGMLDDGFTTSDAAYKQAVKIFSQNPKPPRIAVGRRATAVAQVERIRVTGSADGDYTITIDGVAFTVAAVGQTAAQIRDSLVTLIDAYVPVLGRVDVDATAVSTADLTLTALTAGAPFSVTLTAPSSGMKFVQNVTVGGFAAGTYTIVIGQLAHSVVRDGSGAASDVVTALVAAVDAGSSGVDASDGAGDTVDLLATTPFTVSVSSTGSALTLTAGHRTLSVGIPEDLAAVSDYQPDWYCLLIPDRDALSIIVAAEAIEAQRRIFIAQSNDAEILSLPYDSGNPNADIASKLKSLDLQRTALMYSSDDADEKAAAWVGSALPLTPGSITWKFRQLAGVTPDTFTTTQIANLISKSANGFRTIAGRNITFEGSMAGAEWIDVIHGVDKLFQTIQANVFNILSKSKTSKVPFTNAGLQVVASGVRAALLTSSREGLIAQSRPNSVTGDEETPGFTVSVPNIADISPVDREARTIPASNPITFEGTLAGAVHKVNVTGTLSA